MSLTLGGHAGHLDGIGGEGGQPCDAVLQGHVGEVVGHPCVGAVNLLPRDTVAWNRESIKFINKYNIICVEFFFYQYKLSLIEEKQRILMNRGRCIGGQIHCE